MCGVAQLFVVVSGCGKVFLLHMGRAAGSYQTTVGTPEAKVGFA